MKEDSTIYDAFVIREQQKYEKKQQEKFADKIEAGKEPNGKSLSDGAHKKKNLQKKKVEQSPKKRPFEDGIKEVCCNNINKSFFSPLETMSKLKYNNYMTN